MKKRYLILAGLLVMTVAAAGCGKKQTTETEPVQATATPTPEVTKAVDMVDMQQTSDDDIKNVMGEKTATASKVVFVNNTGDDIQALYIRTHVSDEDSSDEDEEDDGWGEADPTKRVVNSARKELIITGASKDSIDSETYTREAIDAAIEAIKKAEAARSDFGESDDEQTSSSSTDDEWGSGFDDSSDDAEGDVW